MPKPFEATPPWTSFEVVQRDSRGELRADGPRPFWDALNSGGDQLATAFTKIWMVQFLGWPEARRRLTNSQGKPLIDISDEKDGKVIWILKAKPTCWRLYFYVNQSDAAKPYILYLFAVCKKKDRRDASGTIKARNILNGIRPGGSGITEIEFPDR